MKKFFKAVLYHWYFFILLVIIGFLTGYFITDFAVNTNTEKYEVTVKADDINDVYTKEFFSMRLEEIKIHNAECDKSDKISIASLDYGALISSSTIEQREDGYHIFIKAEYSKSIFSNSTGRINEGSARLNKYLSAIMNNESCTVQNISIVGHNNPYLYGGISAIILLVLGFSLFGVILKYSKEKMFTNIADNESIFRTPFHKKYWVHSANVFKSVKNIALIGVLFAMMMTTKLIHIPAGFGPLSIGFGYLFFAVIAMLFGPIAGLTIGLLSDVLGFFLFPSGAIFFPGYTLDAMSAGFVYSICFYKTKITFSKCLYARLIVNLVINVIFGSLWWSIINSLSIEGTMTYLLFISLPKNLVYLLPQSIFLYFLFKALSNPFRAMDLLDERIASNITLF